MLRLTKVGGKKAMVNRHLKGMGGKPQVSAILTPIEKQILDIVNPVTIDGDDNITTLVTIFQFDNIEG